MMQTEREESKTVNDTVIVYANQKRKHLNIKTLQQMAVDLVSPTDYQILPKGDSKEIENSSLERRNDENSSLDQSLFARPNDEPFELLDEESLSSINRIVIEYSDDDSDSIPNLIKSSTESEDYDDMPDLIDIDGMPDSEDDMPDLVDSESNSLNLNKRNEWVDEYKLFIESLDFYICKKIKECIEANLEEIKKNIFNDNIEDVCILYDNFCAEKLVLLDGFHSDFKDFNDFNDLSSYHFELNISKLFIQIYSCVLNESVLGKNENSEYYFAKKFHNITKNVVQKEELRYESLLKEFKMEGNDIDNDLLWDACDKLKKRHLKNLRKFAYKIENDGIPQLKNKVNLRVSERITESLRAYDFEDVISYINSIKRERPNLHRRFFTLICRFQNEYKSMYTSHYSDFFEFCDEYYDYLEYESDKLALKSNIEKVSNYVNVKNKNTVLPKNRK